VALPTDAAVSKGSAEEPAREALVVSAEQVGLGEPAESAAPVAQADPAVQVASPAQVEQANLAELAASPAQVAQANPAEVVPPLVQAPVPAPNRAAVQAAAASEAAVFHPDRVPAGARSEGAVPAAAQHGLAAPGAAAA
jgi:hypothetical protein